VTLLRFPVNDMSTVQLYRTSWFSQNLSRCALNLFMVGEATA